MIYSLEGILVRKQSNEVLLAIGPVTLCIHIPVNAMAEMNAEGSNLKLFISMVWKETGPQLYGFIKPEQVELFERLQTVSGVGPKLALSIMGHYESCQLAQHLQTGDVAALNRIPGIGNKTAQRLIVELKDKAGNWTFSTGLANEHPHAQDALKALINLGYPALQAKRMVEGASQREPKSDLGTLITLALQQGG